MNDEITRQMLMKINELEERLRRIQTERPLFRILNQVTMPQITANQNDYVVGDYDIVELSSDASRNITGIAGGVAGRILILFNAGSQNIVLVQNSVLSVAANRIFNPSVANLTMTPNATGTATNVMLRHNGSGWRTLFRSAP